MESCSDFTANFGLGNLLYYDFNDSLHHPRRYKQYYLWMPFGATITGKISGDCHYSRTKRTIFFTLIVCHISENNHCVVWPSTHYIDATTALLGIFPAYPHPSFANALKLLVTLCKSKHIPGAVTGYYATSTYPFETVACVHYPTDITSTPHLLHIPIYDA